jgi:uncharacterized protein with HEPN domain
MWRDAAYLLDILLAAREAREFSTGLSREQFEDSRLHQHAITKTLEIIGEAAGKISEQTRDAHPDVPWQEIIAMRHRLVHEYARIDRDKVWDVVQNDIPQLIRLVEPLVPPEES